MRRPARAAQHARARRRAADWRRAASDARRPFERLERIGDIVEVDSTAKVVSLLAKRSRWLLSVGQASANELVDGLAHADRAFATNPLDGSGDVVSQSDRGAHDLTLVHLDAACSASRCIWSYPHPA